MYRYKEIRYAFLLIQNFDILEQSPSMLFSVRLMESSAEIF
ncbi:hypothetical protein HMPREF1141_3405 [Clostridium sp. MSTE9]|nr:hypothetical protein HMPREF1141_3405 [Clostridium sp. MSTE9]